jgi:molybdopterin synthase sulfur carrier subunit
MKVHVRFFASLREATGTDALWLDLPEGAGFEALMAALQGELSPAGVAALLAENVRLARNQDLVTPPFELSDGDELAFLPPVTGG